MPAPKDPIKYQEYIKKLRKSHTGYKQTEEHKKKISEAQKRIGNKPPSPKGKKLSEETKKRMSKVKKIIGTPWLKGRKLSKKHKKKIKKNHAHYWRGKTPSAEHKKKLSIAFKGCKSHFWKGGITDKNQIIRTNNEYRIWRDKIFERDKYLCQMSNCDKIERYLISHHIKKFSNFPELRFEISNGITLCKKCHHKTIGKEEKYEELFTNIIKNIDENF